MKGLGEILVGNNHDNGGFPWRRCDHICLKMHLKYIGITFFKASLTRPFSKVSGIKALD